MKKSINKKGIIPLCIGIFLIILAICLYLYNINEDRAAGLNAEQLLMGLEAEQSDGNNRDAPPTITVNGQELCGTVIIEKLNVRLPVHSGWDYTRLKSAPCRYAGSIATGDMIIAAHNYKSHFGNLESLQSGDEISFIDTLGTRHGYTVAEVTTLDGTAVTDMQSGEWDFTLFTCTKSGQQRVTVRCKSQSAP